MSLTFSATKLPMLGKKGEIKPDADGYYKLVLGGLNTFNNGKSWYYTEHGCKQLFTEDSVFLRRIKNGSARAEVGHPTLRPQEKLESFAHRMMDIDMNNVCAHFSEVWLDEDFGRNHPEYGNPHLIAIMGKVKPIPPRGDILLEALNSPKQNICFSIRATADEGLAHGRITRVLKEIYTIDLVNEGGILVASKWDSPACEAVANSIEITQDLIKRIKEQVNAPAFAHESSRELVGGLERLLLSSSGNSSAIYKRW